MTQFLPPNLLTLFAPREPVPYLPPVDKLRCEKEQDSYSGVADFIKYFEDPKETPAPTRVETKEERKERKIKERAEQSAYKLEQDIALWDPYNDENAKGDPFKTLFVARISYDISESKLRREFDEYGPIRRITMIKDKVTGKQRGYAYIEFEHERDMIAAYKKADGKKIDGRRVLVDVERGRTVKGWRPRRLGGGLGNTRKGGNEENTKYSGRDDFDGRDRLLPDDRDRSMREISREKRRSRSRDRNRRSRSRDRDRRRRSRDRKRSTERDVKKEPGEFGSDSARKRGRRSRSRDRNRSKSHDRKRARRSRSRSRGKKERVKTQVKEEMRDGGHGGYGTMVPPPSMFIKQEHQGYQQQNMHYNHNVHMPPLPNQGNPYYPPQSGPNY